MSWTLQVGVKALLKNSHGEFLILRRNPKTYGQLSGSWDLPGGRIEPGQPLLENLRREILEETSLDIDTTNAKLLTAQSIIIDQEERQVTRLTYLISDIDDQLEIKLAEEDIEARWASLEQLKSMSDLDKFALEVVLTLT